MARRALSEVLGDDDPTPPQPTNTEPPFAPGLADVPPHPEEPTTAGREPERDAPDRSRTYKFTANLDDHEYDQLEALTAAIVDELKPRPVGKGWRARTVRTLIKLAAEDEKLRKRVVKELRKL